MNSNILSVSQCIGILAEKALIAEASLSPKPGLVDRFSNGSHKDMTYETFVRSSESLQGYFCMAAFVGYSIQDNMIKRQMLKSLGMKAEEIRRNYDALISYNKIWHRNSLVFPTLPMSGEGAIHFAEVKKIFDGIWILLPVSALAALVFGRRAMRRGNAGFFKAAGKFFRGNGKFS